MGLVYGLDRYWQAGPIRLFNPVAADEWYPRIWGMIATLEVAGSYLSFNYPDELPRPVDRQRAVQGRGLAAGRVDPLWCWAVTGDVTCNTPHDGIVPVTSQVYPGAQNLYMQGPSHLQETTGQ